MQRRSTSSRRGSPNRTTTRAATSSMPCRPPADRSRRSPPSRAASATCRYRPTASGWRSSANSTPKNLTEKYDYDVASGIGGDQAAPRGGNRRPIVWSRDGASLLVVSAEKGSGNLKRFVIATGAVENVTAGAHDLVGYSASADATKIAATESTQT